ncbi:hypothetical protein PR048_008958 [Dryococelus australis]|uniref:Uncharacterized protein n=1 Tax=Dryococelus australis TaxID=614101 RepID=A0ABQ9HYL8_9NEOP|nr:hypothetical protein PR048_008958 [Dryococelus australis]
MEHKKKIVTKPNKRPASSSKNDFFFKRRVNRSASNVQPIPPPATIHDKIKAVSEVQSILCETSQCDGGAVTCVQYMITETTHDDAVSDVLLLQTTHDDAASDVLQPIPSQTTHCDSGTVSGILPILPKFAQTEYVDKLHQLSNIRPWYQGGRKHNFQNHWYADYPWLHFDVQGLYETASVIGEFLFNVIKDALLRLDLNLDKLRGNVTMVAPTGLVQKWVNDIEVIVRDSTKRRAVFSQIATHHNLTSSGPRPLCPTRWTVQKASLSGVLNMYPAVLDFLDTLAYDLSDIGPKARGKIQTVAGAKEAVNVAIQCIKSKISDIAFDGVWDEVGQMIIEMDLSKPTLTRMRILPKRLEQAQNPAAEHNFESVKQYYRKIYYEFLDNIINEIVYRSEQPELEKYLHLEKSLLLTPGSLDEPILTTISAFGIDLTKSKQEKEFIAQLIQTQKSVQNYVNSFKQMHPETKSLFPQLHALLRLLLVVPATSSTAERCEILWKYSHWSHNSGCRFPLLAVLMNATVVYRRICDVVANSLACQDRFHSLQSEKVKQHVCKDVR